MLQKIGKYEIAEQIGIGGFGAVYRARDPHIKRMVAVKTCQVNDEEIKSRFFREAELAGNLHHRHITTIYDFGVENGIPYIVQEFLTGEDLDKKIKRGDPLPLARKVEILMAIADGLHYAHENHIIHRDIKPANIRVLDDGNVKIMDFGIAKSLQSESSLTQTGITLGTSAYLAPEQIRGEPVDRRTDIFALGVLAYELVTYRKPFRGEHLSTVLYRILNEQPEAIPTLAPDTPPTLAAAIGRAMEKSIEKRYPTMEVFRQDLAAVHRELTGSSAYEEGASRPFLSPGDDVTIATPSGGMDTLRHITPPSGALARVPAPAERTPTAARAAAGLELVNFRDPAQAEGEAVSARLPVAPRRPASRRTFVGVVGVALVLVSAAGLLLLRGRSGRLPAPPAVRPTSAPAAPPPVAELPKPEIGVDAAARPTAPAAIPTAAAAAAPSAPPAAPRRFPVQFSSIPAGSLFVDGRSIGPSLPAKVVELEEGTHRVRFESPGLEPHEETFRVGPNGARPIAYQFPIGYLAVRADPSWTGASVIVDGKYKASLSPTEARVKLAPGLHRVILLREGFQPANREVTIEKGGEEIWTPAPAVPVEAGG